MGDRVVQLTGDAEPLLDDRVLPQVAGLGAQPFGLFREVRALPTGSPGRLPPRVAPPK